MGKQEAKLIFGLQKARAHVLERREEQGRGRRGRRRRRRRSPKKIQVCVCLGIMGIWIIKVWYGELVAPLV